MHGYSRVHARLQFLSVPGCTVIPGCSVIREWMVPTIKCAKDYPAEVGTGVVGTTQVTSLPDVAVDTGDLAATVVIVPLKESI